MTAIDKTHDARGRGCPMVMIELNKTINIMHVGDVLEFLTDDPAAYRDISAWSERTGHELLDMREADNEFRFIIRKCERTRNVNRRRDFSRY